jgi:hypothetical protein
MEDKQLGPNPLRFPPEQLVKLADPLIIEAHNFAIENCSFDRQLGPKLFSKTQIPGFVDCAR